MTLATKANKPAPKKSRKFIFNREQAPVVLKKLQKHYPDAHCALKHKNSFELLVATILSAQCTDERVNKVTPDLFAKFPTVYALAEADIKDVENLIRTVGFYHNKSKNLISCAQTLIKDFGGELPRTVEQMTTLAGVGRKTANVVLGNSFGLKTGIAVDTHVGRLSYRLGWSKFTDPLQIEKDLMELFADANWVMFSHYVIFHGRQICTARSPACHRCFLFDHCPKNGV